MQHWFTLSDPAMEEAFFDTLLHREFAQLQEEHILQTVNELLTERGLLLKGGTAMDATLIAVPTLTKNKARDPEMYASKKCNQW